MRAIRVVWLMVRRQDRTRAPWLGDGRMRILGELRNLESEGLVLIPAMFTNPTELASVGSLD